MKLANLDGRGHLVTAEGGCDLDAASNGRFRGDPQALLGELGALQAWLRASPPALDPALSEAALLRAPERLGPPIPAPSQVFAIGINYRAHGAETGIDVPSQPMVFTKFPSSIAGPGAPVRLPSDSVDWEVELVVVIGRGGRDIGVDQARSHVAGYCVGQDLSDRGLQMASKPPQFSLGKSHAAFAPIGPWLTTADAVDDRRLEIGCRRGDEVLQHGTTADMIFDVPTLVSYLSSVCELRPGDLIFSGTPDGVGMGRKPPSYLQPGDLLVSFIDGLGALSNPFDKA